MNERRDFVFDKYKWPLLALWMSIGLHGALIALVKIVPLHEPPASHTIEARLMPASQTREVPLYLPDLKSPAIDEILAYAPPPASPVVSQPSPPPPTQETPIPQIEIPIAVDLHYYSARELDITPIGNLPDPLLPDTLTGKVKYQLKIEEDGRVTDVEVISVDLPIGGDTATALANTEALIRKTRFRPGMKQGRAVRAVVVYELVINPAVASRP
ncbi:MAG: energy transducer TonB [Thiobacillus sp.]